MLSLEDLDLMRSRGNIDSSYVNSIFLEPFYKELLDEYITKTPLDG
jgi:hypothetical protein